MNYSARSLFALAISMMLAACGGGGSSSSSSSSSLVIVATGAPQTLSTFSVASFTGSASSSAGPITSMGWQVQALTLSANAPSVITNADCSQSAIDAKGNGTCTVQITPPKTLTADATYQVIFTAVDNKGNNASTTTSLTVRQSAAQSSVPVATVGTDTSIASGTNVALACAGSAGTPDTNGNYSFQWVVQDPNGLTINIADPSSAKTSFTAPAVKTATPVKLQCRVTDSKQITGTATQTITITPPVLPTVIPVSKSGGVVAAGAVVNLDGTASYKIDANGNTITGPIYFLWTAPPNSTLLVINPTNSVASVAFPKDITSRTSFVFTLNVSNSPINQDGTSATAISHVDVAFYVDPLPPITLTVTNPVQVVHSNAVVDLQVNSGTTAGNSPIYYGWTQLLGTPVTIAGATSSHAGFVAPVVTQQTTLSFRISAGYQPITVTTPGTSSLDVSVVVQP